MNTLDQATQNRLEPILEQIGMSIEDAAKLVRRTGLTQRNDISWMFQREYRIKYDDAKMLVVALFETHLQSAN